MTGAIPLITAGEIHRLLRPRDAVDTIRSALLAGLDPAADPARLVVPTAHGHLLVMPAAGAEHAGVKVAGVAPGNPARGLPRIQGLYLLLDATTLAPVALLDGVALTTVRTPAVSVAAVLPFLRAGSTPLTIAIFGTGPQAVAHGRTLVDTLAGYRDLAAITYLTRRPDGIEPPDHGTVPVTVAVADETVVRQADVVVCATTARDPLFDPALVHDRAVVIAVGSHEPGARELGGALLARSHVIVEDVETALREAGDVVLAVAEGHTTPADLVPVRRVVTEPAAIRFDRPIVFKSTGMAWEDLTIATAVHRRARAADRPDQPVRAT